MRSEQGVDEADSSVSARAKLTLGSCYMHRKRKNICPLSGSVEGGKYQRLQLILKTRHIHNSQKLSELTRLSAVSVSAAARKSTGQKFGSEKLKTVI